MYVKFVPWFNRQTECHTGMLLAGHLETEHLMSLLWLLSSLPESLFFFPWHLSSGISLFWIYWKHQCFYSFSNNDSHCKWQAKCVYFVRWRKILLILCTTTPLFLSYVYNFLLVSKHISILKMMLKVFSFSIPVNDFKVLCFSCCCSCIIVVLV